MRSFLLPLALSAFVVLCGCRSNDDLEVVTGFEMERYLGTWYEAARFPHRFEKHLTAVTAQYTRNDDSTIRVVNRGYNPGSGEWEQAEAVAKFKDDPSRGWLMVSFFQPFYASYKILHLDAAYTEAIVTGPTYNYLWILVRDPALPEARLDGLVSKAAGFGFDTNRIERINQAMHP